jgi:glycosyltransferase involved in cell wall biosynthesis
MSKLLMLITDLHRGGTPTVVRELSRRLHQRGREVEVACLAADGVTGEEIRSSGIEVHPLSARGVWDLGVLLRLAKLIRARRFGRVLSLLVHANASAAVVRRYCPREIRWFQSVQTTQPEPSWHWRVQRRAATAAERLIVPSESVRRVLAERCGVPPERVTVIPNGVDSNRLSLLRPPTGGCVGFIGRLDPIKRVEDLIAAAGSFGGVPVRIWGDGPERNRLERLAEAARASGGADVRFLGAVAAPDEALAQCAALVLPSRAEGFGLVLIEAMAAGVPVVAARSPGIVDVVRHEENGLLFEPGDVSGLAEAVRRSLGASQDIQQQVRAAQAEVRQRYDWDAIVSQYEQALSLDS